MVHLAGGNPAQGLVGTRALPACKPLAEPGVFCFAVKLSVRQGTHGRGVFAETPILAAQRILAFTGPLLRYTETTHQTRALQVGPDRYIGPSGGPDDFVNHSCEPNAWVRITESAVELVALRDIAAEEEIFFDYSTTLDEDDFTMVCQCGTPSCRKTVSDGKYLPEIVWQRYIRLGIIPPYVMSRRGA
jgi:hypothetical protein